jgi:hypothetical protein
MFGLFKNDPVAKLEKKYDRLLEDARDLQRGGDIQGFAAKTEEAEAVRLEIEKLLGEK